MANKQNKKRLPVRSTGEGKARPLDTEFDIFSFSKKFKGKVLHFITMNPYKKGKRFQKLQRIGAAFDVLKKYSPHFLIVREFNPDGTSHYHALCSKLDTDKLPPKNMTFFVERVGGEVQPRSIPEPGPTGPTTLLDQEKWQVLDPLLEELGCHHHLLNATKRLLSYIWNMQRKARAKYSRSAKASYLETHVTRVLSYMSKDFNIPPTVFHDYIYYEQG